MQLKNIGEVFNILQKNGGIFELQNWAKGVNSIDAVAVALKKISSISDDVKVGILSFGYAAISEWIIDNCL